MQAVTDDQVAELLPALEEAARATQRTIERFVPPRVGIVGQVAARRHQLVVGRRGVGKTTLLRKVEAEIEQDDGAVTFVDLETLRGIDYPDVLIRLLMSLFDSLSNQLLGCACVGVHS